MNGKKKVWVDMDTGTDDAQALMIALASPNVEVLGISCCHGNTSIDNACKNTLRVLWMCGRLDVSFSPTLKEEYVAKWQHLVVKNIHLFFNKLNM